MKNALDNRLTILPTRLARKEMARNGMTTAIDQGRRL
jgi:hypothetical protein